MQIHILAAVRCCRHVEHAVPRLDAHLLSSNPEQRQTRTERRRLKSSSWEAVAVAASTEEWVGGVGGNVLGRGCFEVKRLLGGRCVGEGVCVATGRVAATEPAGLVGGIAGC